MTITSLPEDTVRLLGSNTVITTPVDLVKELLDNAIDAKATSVEILVSPNIVDRIEVRDNGYGIHPLDYDSLGRAGHTSKIKAFEDLRTLGGTTLGFRGQALSSANNLGAVTITTRTAEDPTAVVLKLTPGVGGVHDQSRSPAPVGTTVTVAGLYSRMPVRARVAAKDTLKNLAKIKHLLHFYALARPQIRLSFRVLEGGIKLAFSYSPRPGAGVKEALVQIFGMDLASQCLIETICSATDEENAGDAEDRDKFCIQAVLPRPDADQACISKGAFFFVDSRPVSTQRETMKKLLATFRAHFSRYVEAKYGEKPFRDPFICVNVKCSPGSYDLNIEPSKDVVLFASESHVTDLFERLCSDVYRSQGPLDLLMSFGKRQLPQSSQVRTPPISSDGPGDEGSLPMMQSRITRTDISRPEARRLDRPGLNVPRSQGCRLDVHLGPPQIQPTPLPSSSPTRERPARNVSRRRPLLPSAGNGFTIDMLADPDLSSDDNLPQEEMDSRRQVGEEEGESREALNPWVIAKINAPVKMHAPVRQVQHQQVQEQPSSIPNEVFENLPVLRPFGEAPADLHDLHDHREGRLGTTQMERHRSQQSSGFRHPLSFSPIGIFSRNHHFGPVTSAVGRDALQTSPQTNEAAGRRTLPNLRSYNDGVAENVGLNGLVQARLDFGGRPRRPQPRQDGERQRHIDEVPLINPPFRRQKPVKAGGKKALSSIPGHANKNVADWVDNSRLTEYDLIRRPSTHQPSHSPRPSTRTSTADSMGRQHLPTVPKHNATRGNDGWVDEDSRKFLMKRQRSEAEHHRRGHPTLKRVKTERLPLETIPESQALQGLVLIVAADTERLAENLIGRMVGGPFYDAFRREIGLSEEMGLDDAMDVEVRLKDVLSTWTEKVLGKSTEVNFDLRTKVKGKGVAIRD